jgi:hypothetical protein
MLTGAPAARPTELSWIAHELWTPMEPESDFPGDRGSGRNSATRFCRSDGALARCKPSWNAGPISFGHSRIPCRTGGFRVGLVGLLQRAEIACKLDVG